MQSSGIGRDTNKDITNNNDATNTSGSSARLRPLLPSTQLGGGDRGSSTGSSSGTNSIPTHKHINRPKAPTDRTTQDGPALKKKRATVPAACEICRKRKIKCDAVRPKCAPCTASGSECTYSVPEGLSQRDAERQKSQDLRTILTLLRRARGPESAEILRQVREAETLDDAVARIADASLLLPAPPSSGLTAAAAATTTTTTPPASSTVVARTGTTAPRTTSAWVAMVTESSTPSSTTLSASRSPRDDSQAGYDGRPSPNGSYQNGYDNGGYPRYKRRIMSPFDKPDYIFESLFERSFRDGDGSGSDPRLLELPTITVLPVSRWTSISDDDKHMTHLITLFWTWDNTFIRLFDRELFVEDMRCADPTILTSNNVFCSSFVVNCLLAVGCLYSTQDRVYDILGDNNSRGRRFADEAIRQLVDERKRPSLTLLQGICLLYLYEGSVRDGELAARLFEEMYSVYFGLGLDKRTPPSARIDPHSKDGRVIQATSHILWGFFCLNAKIGLNFTAPLRAPRPLMPKTFASSRLSYLANPESASFHWHAYPVNFRTYPSHFREVLVAEASFAEIVEDIMSAAGYEERVETLPDYGPGMATLLRYEALYERLMRWKAELPEHLLPNNTILPSVLSLHATFDMAVVKLLTPLIKKFPFERFSSSTPSALKIAATYSLIGNIWTFRTLYTLKHEYWLMQSCFTAATSVVLDLDKMGTVDIFIKACQGLHEMGEFLKLANKFLLIIQDMVTQFKVKIPDVGRSVRAKYFEALKERQSSKYIDGSHVLLSGQDVGLKDVRVSDVVDRAVRVEEIGVD